MKKAELLQIVRSWQHLPFLATQSFASLLIV